MDPTQDWITTLFSDLEEDRNEESTSNTGASSSTGPGNNNKLPMMMISPPDKEQMFEKVVTLSDVGKLNRLVIPRQHAERYFPLNSSNNQNGTLLNFQDRNGKMWRFRYSYWNTSKRYVMTKGWSGFVKEKQLDAGDIVSFLRGIGDESARSKLYIDWSHRSHMSLVQNPLSCSSFSSNFNFPTTSEYSSSFHPFSEYISSPYLKSFQFYPFSEYTSSLNVNSSQFHPLLEYASVQGFEHSGGNAFSGESNSGSTITTVAGTSNPNSDDNAFSSFLSTRGLTLPSCTATDIIDFLCAHKDLSDSNALVGRLRAACEEGFGIKPKDNPFCSLALIRYLRKNSWKKESIFVFSCNDNVDVEETSFINAIVTELHQREVTPLTYNLSGIEILDAEMVYRCNIGIVVLSNSFTRTSQSLDHLVEIMEHCKAKDLVVIPVYFMVTPSGILEDQLAVQQQYRYFIQADRVQKWKAAIAEFASIDGHQWTDGTQFILAKEVVRDACLRLHVKNSDNLVRILALLDHPKPSDAEIEGIWGMAGIGKTSIAREIFEILAPRYDLCYFLQDFHRLCQSKGPRQIRDDFFSKLFGEEKLSIGVCDTKSSFMRDWFHNKAILVVLDDVTNARDAEYVVGGFGWFSHGHKIILTSRRKQVLVQCKVKKPYKIQKLDEFDSFHLCKQYLEEESAVISELMSCSSGIPLALKVLGSSVSKQHINNMMEHLQNLRRNPPTQIQEAFRRSFDGLDENEKNIFLDLACFFRGEKKDYVVQLLDACGFLTYLGICDLIDESLISLVDNSIEMPIPFQDIGRFIVHEEADDPCERSRLWDYNDIAYVLTNNSGTEAIEGIFLDASDLTCELSPTVFGKMYRLRLLRFYCSTSANQCKLSLPQGLETLPDELRLLHWEYYPLIYLPQKFNPENLVEVNMPYSNMEKLWEGKKNLEKLKKINLSHSRNLTDILMLSEALNLEHIELEGCTSLVDISTSIPRCGKLVSLNMKDCSHLQNLPRMVDLESLKLLNVSGCSELKEIKDFAPNLKELYLAGTAIRELPLSVKNLTKLSTLDLQNCRRLQQLPIGIKNSKSIVKLKLSGCTSLGHTSMGGSVNSPFPNWKRKR